MLSYLAAETAFLRAFGNRCLVLLVLCVLTRTSDSLGKASLLGITVDISPGMIVVVTPILALLFMIGMQMEANILAIARNNIVDEMRKNGRYRLYFTPYYLFFPPVCVFLMISQFIQSIVPADQS